MMSMLIRLPLAALYALAIIIMIICALPFVVVGFCLGFIKWSGEIGCKLADRLFFHFR